MSDKIARGMAGAALRNSQHFSHQRRSLAQIQMLPNIRLCRSDRERMIWLALHPAVAVAIGGA